MSIDSNRIIKLTLQNTAAHTALAKLTEAGKLVAILSSILIDENDDLPRIWSYLKPTAPETALPFCYDEWITALKKVSQGYALIDELDGALQILEFSGRDKEAAIMDARADWEAIMKLRGEYGRHLLKDFPVIAAIFNQKFEQWPQEVKEHILSRGPLNEQLVALQKSLEFRANLKQALPERNVGSPG